MLLFTALGYASVLYRHLHSGVVFPKILQYRVELGLDVFKLKETVFLHTHITMSVLATGVCTLQVTLSEEAKIIRLTFYFRVWQRMSPTASNDCALAVDNGDIKYHISRTERRSPLPWSEKIELQLPRFFFVPTKTIWNVMRVVNLKDQ